MRCPTCGAEVADGAKFCETCGTPLQQMPQQPTQPTNNPYGKQGYEAPRSSEPAAGGPAPSWEGTPQVAPTPQAAPPKQGSSAPFVLAIIALVTAVLGLFPISLVLAIIALAMNRGQKKRGEQSTKQTPTFVMALISLILSILVALATVALGGLIWLAVMDDDTPDETFEGDWESDLGLEALGAGRFALTDFWQKGDRQYGMGSFMWPSGETDTVLLVRP